MDRLLHIAILLLTLTIPTQIQAQEVYVPGHYRGNGAYVQPHYRSTPNRSPYDNWSSQGNVNPHTGQTGTQNRNPNTPPYSARSRRGGNYRWMQQIGPGNKAGMKWSR